MRYAVLLVGLLACGGGAGDGAAVEPAPRPAPEPAPGPDPAHAPSCERLPFAKSVPVQEASGAAVMHVDGRDVVMVIGDSDQAGSYALLDVETGDAIEMGQLPLGDGAGDDLEGLSVDGDRVIAVTSAGWMRAWKRVSDGFELVDGPYPIGEGSMVCNAYGVNCGKNYEGLCTTPDGPCAGWVASKADGHLYCLASDGERLHVEHRRRIHVTHHGALTGCDADPVTGTVWASTNAFDGALYRIDGTTVTRVEVEPGPFPEAIAVAPGGVLLRFSDLGGGRSPVERWRCR